MCVRMPYVCSPVSSCVFRMDVRARVCLSVRVGVLACLLLYCVSMFVCFCVRMCVYVLVDCVP